jgi:hypothetical protein
MGNLTFIDSAFPMGSYPAADGFAFYIGGDTPHVWSSAEVAVLKQHYRYLLPIYVRSNPPGPGAAADVAACVAKLKSLGAPAGTLVSWDSEMAVDAPYIQAVYADLHAAGYVLVEYASQSVVFAEGNPDGYYWGADWTNVAHFHSGDVLTQYISYSGYDESLASASLPFWDTRGAAPPPAVNYNIASIPPGQWQPGKPVILTGTGTDGKTPWHTATGNGRAWTAPVPVSSPLPGWTAATAIFSITVPPPGWYKTGTACLLEGTGTDNALWRTATPDGVSWEAVVHAPVPPPPPPTYAVTKLPPGDWQTSGTVTLTGNGPGGAPWTTTSADGVKWTPPAKKP